MRIALLAAFPLQAIPPLGRSARVGHPATWLPMVSDAFRGRKDFDLHWLVIARGEVPREPVRWNEQTFHVLPSPTRGRIFHCYWPDSRVLQARLDELQPDLVHAWGTEDCYGLTAARSRWPWLLSMQGILHEYLQRAPRSARYDLKTRLQERFEASVLRSASEITVESRWGMRVLQLQAPHARVHAVEYGVQERFYDATWQPDPQRPRAVFIGSIDARKGVADAVAAFANERLRGAELQIVGDFENPLGRRLRLQSGGNIHWLGRLSREQTIETLSRAWCLVLPTRADTSPNVVKEARVIGLPVVTTPHGGQSDYVEHGRNGFLLEPGDLSGLADALAKLLKDLPLARCMGAELHEEQRTFFRPERTAQCFQNLYANLVEHRRSQGVWGSRTRGPFRPGDEPC